MVVAEQPESDRIYKLNINTCNQCEVCDVLYVLANSEDEADKLEKNGAGLCGSCMCENIMDTNGYVVTKKD